MISYRIPLYVVIFLAIEIIFLIEIRGHRDYSGCDIKFNGHYSSNEYCDCTQHCYDHFGIQMLFANIQLLVWSTWVLPIPSKYLPIIPILCFFIQLLQVIFFFIPSNGTMYVGDSHGMGIFLVESIIVITSIFSFLSIFYFFYSINTSPISKNNIQREPNTFQVY